MNAIRFACNATCLAMLATGLAHAAPTMSGCPVFPADNVWNTRVDWLPVHPNSAAYVNSIGAASGFHMDFGSGLYEGAPIGIPFITVPGTQPKVPVSFDVADESDAGPYPIPPTAPIEGGPASDGDRHVLVLDRDNCKLYETFYSFPVNGGTSWQAYSGAVYTLGSHALRPSTWTSADAAGLPVLPGLARFDEVAAGKIEHALRFTASVTQRAFIWPARHFASSNTDTARPPMGLRLRLKSNVNIDAFPAQAKVIAQAMKTYGIILADNGSNWFVSGAPDDRWDNNALRVVNGLRGSDFEAVDTAPLMIGVDSGQACQPGDADGDGIPGCLEAREGRNAAIRDNDVFTSARLFAMQQYRDFLAREGDAGGLTHWTGQVANGVQSRGSVIESFFNSAEFQGTISPVARLYFAYFLRVPDYDGINFWINFYRSGNALESVSNYFTQSAEFQSAYGALNNTQFVTLVYNNVLGRAPDAPGLAFWKGQLDQGKMTRGRVMMEFSESAEYKQAIFSEVFVTMVYLGMLRRGPDAGGFAYWVDYMDDGNSGLALINGFLGAPEYRNRFLP